MAVAAGDHSHGSLELGRTTGPDYSHRQLSGTYTDIAELSESSNFPLHSTATDMTSSNHRDHLAGHHSQDTTLPDETMSEDRLSPLPHTLNHAAMWENSQSQGTAFVVVNGMTVIRPDESSNATVDESQEWDWCDVSQIVVAAAAQAAAAASQLEHNDGDAAVVSESAADVESESLALDTMVENYIDWPDSSSSE